MQIKQEHASNLRGFMKLAKIKIKKSKNPEKKVI